MRRREALMACAALPASGWQLAHAHHGWSSFDQDRPVYLEGRATEVSWRNPHVEFKLEVPAGLQLPADLAQRNLPAQAAPIDGKALLAKAVLPVRKDRVWEIELAPLTRVQAWNIAPIQPGAVLSVLGFTFTEEKGAPILRAEYLFVGGKAYALRSGPA